MDNQAYLSNYLAGVQENMLQKDFSAMIEEINKFKLENMHLTPSEFRKKLNDEYGELFNCARIRSLDRSLVSINKKLYFFVVLTVVGLAIALLALISEVIK